MSTMFYPLEEFGHKTQQAITPIVAIADGEVIPLGTGFVISPDGLMMTAKHVIEDFCVPNPKRRDGLGRYKEASLFAIYISGEKHGEHLENYLGGPMPIQKVWFSAELDIAYCWPASPIINDAPIRFPIMRLSPGIPAVGEKIIGFGYYKSAGTLAERVGETQSIDYSHDTAFTKGRIEAIYSPKRDDSFLRFPCFQTDARFEPGMSGGPVLNESGSVCGVICSSYGNIPDETGHISFCSLLWLAFGTSVEVALKEGGPVQMVSVYDLVKMGIIVTDETINQIKVEVHEDNRRTVYVKKRE